MGLAPDVMTELERRVEATQICSMISAFSAFSITGRQFEFVRKILDPRESVSPAQLQWLRDIEENVRGYDVF